MYKAAENNMKSFTKIDQASLANLSINICSTITLHSAFSKDPH